jgi:hypothetical protein
MLWECGWLQRPLVLWLQAVQISLMFTSVSMSWTAIGLLSEFEAENVYIVNSLFHPTEQNFGNQAGIRFSNVKSNFLFRFLWFQFVSSIFTAIQVPILVLVLVDVSQTGCHNINMIHCCSVLLTCRITKQPYSTHIQEFWVTSFGFLTWKSWVCVELACF